jgi:two-component system, OmpR family, phosphate regulon response regulator PhoB
VQQLLIIEDDVDIGDLVAFKLRQRGFDVRTESDGEAGLAVATVTVPDLVVLDLMMPKLSGIDVCRRLRSTPATAATPIVMLTAKAQEADVELGFAVGATDYLVKPFSPRELVSRVQSILARATG